MTDQIVHPEYVQFIVHQYFANKTVASRNKTFSLKSFWLFCMMHSSLRYSRQRETKASNEEQVILKLH
jgi:hypothetical protein